MLAFRGAGQRLLAAGGLRAAADAFRDGAWVAALAGLTRQAGEPTGEPRVWTDVLTRPQRQPEPRRVQPKAVPKS